VKRRLNLEVQLTQGLAQCEALARPALRPW
jgi:hypothetical protein